MTHEKTVLQQISDVAWLVQQGATRVGILNKDVQENFTYITGKELVSFKNEDEVRTHFGNMTLFQEQITTSLVKQDAFYIKGFEIKYEAPYALDSDHPDYNDKLPLYTKIAASNVYYAAGYYCINFEKGWKPAHGPKLATLTKYGYAGPYNSELEMRQQLKKFNKQRRRADDRT